MTERTHPHWFETQGSYDGHGMAEFTAPQGRIEGPTSVTFDERGVFLVEMTVERIECERELKLSQFEFFSGREPRENGKAIILSIGADENPCSKLSVKSARGTFVAEGHILYSLSYGQQTTVRFHSVRSQFDSSASAAPKFWVLPTYNFVSRFLDYDPTLDQHPLNVQWLSRIDSPPSDIEGELLQPNDPGLIIFTFNGRPAFIKPLPDYPSRVAQLENERQPRVITALVVGELSTEGMDFEDLERWLPLNIMGLLGLATGTLIAAPWVEFRDSDGLVVRRAHVSLGIARFVRGHRSIDEVVHRGTGRLLTRALASANFNKDYLHASTRHLILAGAYEDTTVEDKLTHLARAIDCISHELGITGYNVLDQLKHPDHRRSVKQELQAAAKRVGDLAKAATDRGDLEEGTILRNISDRTMSNPAYRVNNFGAAVRMLLKESGFADAHVIDRYFSEHPRTTGESWEKLLSTYRGRAIHQSYFDDTHDVLEVWRIIQHLHDIVARYVLKAFDYDGTYQPIVSQLKTAMAIDWVKWDTLPKRLGYE